MAQFKSTEVSQGLMLCFQLKDQIMEGSFESALNILFDSGKINLSSLLQKYRNDHTGRKAYHPRILLKIILYGYYKGILSSRELETLCKKNLIFMALSENEKPDHSTISTFLSSMSAEASKIFEQIVLICHEPGLIQSGCLAIDGCKISSNASKEWSGTMSDLKHKQEKIKKKIKEIIKEHRNSDSKTALTQKVAGLESKIKKISEFLANHDKKTGKRNHEKQSNITDNESCKMKTSHGVLQGYNGVAVVDSSNQIIVEAEAFGEGQEYEILQPMMNKTETMLHKMGKNVSDSKLLADTGYFKESNLAYLSDKNIDAYIPDQKARLRNAKFKTRSRHREIPEKREYKKFTSVDFKYIPDRDEYLCPNNEILRRWGEFHQGKSFGRKYGAMKRSCSGCKLKLKCISENETRRELRIYDGVDVPHVNKMRTKIDSDEGRKIYSLRMSIIEPVFANIRFNKGLDYFTLRTKAKVNIQWLFWCMVHNIEKIVTRAKL